MQMYVIEILVIEIMPYVDWKICFYVVYELEDIIISYTQTPLQNIFYSYMLHSCNID